MYLTIVFIGMLALTSFFTKENSLSGFKNWRTGSGAATEQLMPKGTKNPLTIENGKVVAHARFRVVDYGEMSFPIDPNTPQDEEAYAVDLSNSDFIRLCYKSNTEVILQLREYKVHGGVQNHITLPVSKTFTTRKIPLSAFLGGLTPLNLQKVAKFNFAVLKNNPKEGFADLVVVSFEIEDYEPVSK